MTEQLDEALSAALDGEADEFELRRVLDETAKHEALRDTWDRYHRVSDYLSVGDAEAVRPRNFANMQQSVWEAIGGDMADSDDDASVESVVAISSASKANKGTNWSGRLLGFGVAATVAFAVMMVSGVFTGGQTVGTPGVADAQTPAPISLDSEISPEDLKRNAQYIRHHVQHTAVSANNGLTSGKMVVELEQQIESEQAEEDADKELLETTSEATSSQ